MRSGFCLLAIAIVLVTCGAPASRMLARGLPAPRVVSAVANDQVTVNVLELFCQSCAEQIISGCRGIDGVTAVDVDRKEKLLTLHFDSAVISRERVLAAVDDVVSNIP